MARNYLAIPGSNAAVERLFSWGKWIASDVRPPWRIKDWLTVSVVYLAIHFDPILAILMLAVLISYIASSRALAKHRMQKLMKQVESDKHQHAM
ncbi:hypothetical protein BT69DRAFT_1276136 [Atractiella rhizophila]|nr:hypothetical protein BT69DRAFT_1276136 [Atractiella rhizophila]